MKRLTLATLLILLAALSCSRDADVTTVIGPTGPQGQIGSVGSKGADGTLITVVKLCPGTTTYPSTFVEVAFCLEGRLYGTYSANGGFSTELPPGSYQSNAIGSSCNFSVLPNCEIN